MHRTARVCAFAPGDRVRQCLLASDIYWLGITGAQAAAVLQAYGGIVAGINAMPDMTVPVDLRGTLSDQHVRTKSQALYGEMYFDLNEDTMLTIGARYDDFLVDSSNFNDLVGRQYVARGGNAYANPRDIPGMLQKRTVTDTKTSNTKQ